eukprot:TRINITY_DN3489_c0_g1_i3.p1 TRINITY_DN3489_c0_g1~~TRINITY_DN3489_c0_g1_i3.p1  ORF type:complete len:103 (-),score=25.46 TRINITY_DN3489_c0_g1_i3:378-686(-)
MIRRPPRSTQSRSSAASDVYKRQPQQGMVAVVQPPGMVAVTMRTYRMGAGSWCLVILLVLIFWPLCWIPCVCEACQEPHDETRMVPANQAHMYVHHGHHGHH